jgi:hypothetical protein
VGDYVARLPVEIVRVYETIGTHTPCIRPTELYSETWLLRLFLSLAFSGSQCLPFSIESGTRWFSEALLPSRFLPRFRADTLAEGETNADGVVGHFRFDPRTKAGLLLEKDCSQFVVCEAKMFSKLSNGTTKAPTYDQAARSVGCIAHMLSQLGKPVESIPSLGFFVFAPESEISHPGLRDKMQKDSIRKGLKERVASFRSETCFQSMSEWLERWALPTVDRIQLGLCSWESLLDNAAQSCGQQYESLREFYERCLAQR